MLDHILVAVDGSPSSELAAGHAAAVAHAFSSRIQVLRVLEAADRNVPVDSVEWSLQKASAASYVSDLRKRMEDAGVTADAEVREGRAAEEILAACGRHEASLVVLGTHGQAGNEHFHLSGTVQEVVENTTASVLVVPPESAPGTGLDRRYGRVLAGIDCSARANWAAQQAAAIAQWHDSELLLVHVVPTPATSGNGVPLEPADRELVERLRDCNRRTAARHCERMVADFGASNVRIRCRTAEGGQVARLLDAIVREEAPDLVVLAAHGGGHAGIEPDVWNYGSVAHALVLRPRRPTLILQDVKAPAWETAPSRFTEEAPRGPIVPVEARS